MVFLADLPIFHCAGPTRVCVEGHGLTEAFGVADVAESSRQVTPDDSSQTRSPGWCPSACGIFLQDGWVSVCVFRGWGGGGYWTKLLSMPVLPRALAENIESRESGNPASITFLSPITFMIFS